MVACNLFLHKLPHIGGKIVRNGLDQSCSREHVDPLAMIMASRATAVGSLSWPIGEERREQGHDHERECVNMHV